MKIKLYIVRLIFISILFILTGCSISTSYHDMQNKENSKSQHITNKKAEVPKQISTVTDTAIFQHGYPRFFQFRISEGLARGGKYSYQEWEKFFNPYDGIMGKVLNEEAPGREEFNIQYFTQFKNDHPEKLVLLHHNGSCVQPEKYGKDYFDGHWLYYNGSLIDSDIAATTENTEIVVEDPNLFNTKMGTTKNETDEMVIYALKEDGNPDWNYAEQVKLISIDKKRKVICVQRGFYGSKPLEFKSGQARVAAHVISGPFGNKLMWEKNLSIDCPKDQNGNTAADVYVNQLVQLLSPGGILENFDGIQFDVLADDMLNNGRVHGRGVDIDGDNIIDGGYINGVNHYGIGIYNFLKSLRESLGDNKLIMADGGKPSEQRGFGIINGIETEGFPHVLDPEIVDWSRGLNYLLFWQENARKPVFQYINHKFRLKNVATDGVKNFDAFRVPDNLDRLVFAVAQITDSIITYSKEGNEEVQVYDEIVKGKENTQGWLGQPLKPPVRTAQNTPDLLSGNGISKIQEFVVDPDLRLAPKGLRKYVLEGVNTNGTDLTVFCTMSAESIPEYPEDYARQVWIKAMDNKGKVVGSEQFSWVNQKDFQSTFYFRDINTSFVDLEINIEGIQPVQIKAVTAHAHPDVIYREYEHGVVLVNPSLREYSFDLNKLFPGEVFTHINGFRDPKTNNGQQADKTVTLDRLDGLFLIKNKR